MRVRHHSVCEEKNTMFLKDQLCEAIAKVG